jgi:hypothetical protein
MVLEERNEYSTSEHSLSLSQTGSNKHILQEQGNIQLFVLCETFLNSTFSDAAVSIPGYQIIRKDRQSNGGGLIIYVRSDIVCERMVKFEKDDLEMIWLKIRHGKQNPFLLGYVCRPPSATQDWLVRLENTMEQIVIENTEIIQIILLGDLNFDYSDLQKVNKLWIGIVYNSHLIQMVKTHTTVTNLTATIIDHIYTNLPNNVVKIHVQPISLSDHYAVF